MTTYYVSQQTGNDGDNGTTPALAKATIAGAEAIGLAADDIVYIGPGTYREAVTLTDSGTSGHPIKWIADPECEFLTTDKPGVVRWTSADANEVAGNTFALFFGELQYIEVYGPFVFDGSDSGNAVVRRLTAYDATCKVYDCLSMGRVCFTNLACYRCVAIGRYGFTGCYTECCLGFCQISFNLWQNGTRNCMAIGGEKGFAQTTPDITCYNCVAVGCSLGFEATDNAVDYNACYGAMCNYAFNGSTRTGCTYSMCAGASIGGTGTVVEADVVSFANFDLIKRAFEPGLSIAALYNAGNDSYPAGVTDLLNRTRQLGAVDIGCYELADETLDYAVYQTAPPSIKITGIGQKVIQIAAKASTLITVTVQSKHDSATTRPQIILRGQSITDQTDTVTAGNDTWEELSVSATPTINEVLELVLYGREAVKLAYFSDIEVA